MTGSFDRRFAAALLGLLVACTPTLDWREVHAEDDVDAHLPDGTPVQEHAAFFVQDLRLYRASVIGVVPAPGAVETFLGGLGLPR